MKAYYSENRLVNLSDVDYNGFLSPYSIFRYFEDVATTHATILGVGYQNMIKNNLFWVAIKTIVKINSFPSISDNVIVETFPSEPNKLRCDRFYNIYDFKGDLLISAKTEWTVINFITKRPEQIRSIYPTNVEYELDKPRIENEFSRYESNIDGYNPLFKYRVKSTDIDLGKHLNNAEYIRIVLSSYKTQDLDKYNIKMMEINYKSAAYEKEELTFYKKEDGLNDLFIALNSDNKIVINMIISKEKK